MVQDTPSVFVIILSGFILMLLMGSFIILMVLLHRKRQIENKQRLEALQAEFDKTILNAEKEIQEETLSHVGRELHDNIGQLLSLTKLTLNSSKPEKIQEGRQLVNQVIKEVRTLSKDLNLDWVNAIDLEAFIKRELSKLEDLNFCQIEFEKTGQAEEVDQSKKLVLIRVIQECLNNVIKHAQPKKLVITLIQNPQLLAVHIEDDGVGFDTQKASNGSGMYNLQKRMQTIGGSISITSELGKGTLVKLILPNSIA
ncbi:sensor histidine kinase [Belliella pelovolcani]|uniref:histidine kinase n=1 Tax=Belliella pelovolcani TaxID=529505 RepID=A0A1N7JRR9_9BACT|nr:ATP-binding protein [Belliella pelovolcani]SIS51971.1 Histidine kinase [Belliella pelovolcani]